ncbi:MULTISPECIES: PAS domain-containing sensor histidine kinase [unclassified Flavobacterium]|uniref:sensor histidine kinase n=1 Tax=unclassified Flavobacterium TaxID=196869 RepID=UPI003F90AB36
MNPKKSKYDRLRERAEKKLIDTLAEVEGVSLDEAKTLLHELEVHQIELEMQNEELRESQHRLEEVKDQYTDLFDFAPVGYIILDKNGIIVNINLTVCDLIGVERSFIKGKPLSKYLKSTDAPILFIKLQEAFHLGRLELFEIQVQREDKSLFTAALQGIVTMNKEHTDFLCRMSFQDVTTVRVAEELLLQHKALQVQKEIIQEYLKQAPIVYVLLDTNNQVQMINKKGCTVIGTDESYIIGKEWFKNFYLELDSSDFKYLNIDGNGKESISPNFESKLKNFKNQEIILYWTNVTLQDDKGQHIGTLMAGEDITDRKEMDLRKEQYTQDLEDIVEQRTKKLTEALHNEKMVNEMKTAFVSMASHEFRTPLTSVLSSAILIEKYFHLKDFDKQPRHIERIKSSVHQLTSILEDFLSMDKLERGIITTTKEQFDLKKFTEEIIEELHWSLKKNQSITLNFKGETLVVLDRKIVRNIFLNLITNAIKYSNDRIIITIQVKDMVIHIDIIDHGIGIPEEEQKFLFTKFFRAKNAINIQGTGLGLSIVKHYIDLLQGDISFVSALGKGTKFSLSFPQDK